MARVFLAMGVCFFALTGCVSANPEAIGPFPLESEKLVRDQVRQSFFDPYSIRDARISVPEQGHLFFQQGWIVCLEANAKNRMGGYTGLKRTAFLIHNNQIVNTVSDAPLCTSPNLIYSSITFS
jgi:hypothetical protein